MRYCQVFRRIKRNDSWLKKFMKSKILNVSDSMICTINKISFDGKRKEWKKIRKQHLLMDLTWKKTMSVKFQFKFKTKNNRVNKVLSFKQCHQK